MLELQLSGPGSATKSSSSLCVAAGGVPFLSSTLLSGKDSCGTPSGICCVCFSSTAAGPALLGTQAEILKRAQ